MQERLNNLHAFIVVAQEQNITRAAAKLGISQASLSQIISKMEHQLGLKLLNRTTRSLALTEAGEQFITLIGPALEEIQQGLTQIIDEKNRPSGTIRLVSDDYAIQSIVWPKIKAFLDTYPNIHVEIISDYGVIDLSKGQYDGGIARGDLIAKDMATMPISNSTKMVVVAAPSYFAKHPQPVKPKDLVNHVCINQRLPSQGGMLFTWKFMEKKKEVKIHVNGQLTFSNIYQVLDAALAGYGLAYLPEQLVTEGLAQGKLISVLEEKCITLPPYYIYYPTRLQTSVGFSKLLETLKI